MYYKHLSRWKAIVLALAVIVPAMILSGCHVVRFFVWNFADVRDYKKFPKIDIAKGGQPFLFAANGGAGARIPKDVTIRDHKYEFDELLEKTKTVSFIIIRNDTILYNKYFRGYDSASIIPSFSMAKSFTSMLVGIAINDGLIGSVHDPIVKYLPELTHPGFEKITIEHLLDMQSGIKFNEGYTNPFGEVAKYYYGVNIRKYIKQLKVSRDPGQAFEYRSVNSQLLGMIVERVTHKSLAAYMEEKIWKHIGAEYDASWSIDSKKDKEVKAYCCFNARPLDFARLGRLYLKNGNWNGNQLVSEQWVKQSLNAAGKNYGIYSYQWWHTQDKEAGDFYAQGLLGEIVYVYPKKNIIIVRLGKKEGINAWGELMKGIARAN